MKIFKIIKWVFYVFCFLLGFYSFVFTDFKAQWLVSYDINFKLALFYLVFALLFGAIGFIIRKLKEPAVICLISFSFYSLIFLIMSLIKILLHLLNK
jgi:hypothetical protein